MQCQLLCIANNPIIPFYSTIFFFSIYLKQQIFKLVAYYFIHVYMDISSFLNRIFCCCVCWCCMQCNVRRNKLYKQRQSRAPHTHSLYYTSGAYRSGCSIYAISAQHTQTAYILVYIYMRSIITYK